MIEKLSKKQIEWVVKNKLHWIKNNTKDSLHHILAKSREDEGYRSRDKKAQIVLEEDLHNKFHQFFENLLPHEQFVVLMLINWNVMSDYVKNALQRIKVEEFYDDEFLFKDNY